MRFVDDIVITSPTKEKIEKEILPKLKDFLKIRGLKISNAKSSIINLDVDKFNYLG
jgi:RNA-directed DNA polymerase